MKKLSILVPALLALSAGASAQAINPGSFHKGSLLVSVSEGGAYTKYHTTTAEGNTMSQGNVNGDRDPLTVEYGLSNHLGIGLNMGGDVFNIDPSKYYNLEKSEKVKVVTSEVTADLHYHFFVTKHTDLSAFGSVGLAGITIEGGKGESKYKHTAGGGILRGGLEARYYVCKRFGFLAMVSAYTSKCDTKDVKDNTFGNNVTTTINGAAWELGMCFRFLR